MDVKPEELFDGTGIWAHRRDACEVV